MAKFIDEWFDPNEEINNGRQWQPYSNQLSVSDMNKIVNNLIYLKNRIVDGTGTILTLGGETVASMEVDSTPQESGTNRLVTSAGVFNAIQKANNKANIVSGVWVAGTYTTSGWGSTTINISPSYNSNTDMFSTSSNSITIKKSGYYEVCAITGIRCSLTASLQIEKNSTTLANNWSSVETYGILNSEITTYLNENDIIKFKLYGETGGTGELTIPSTLGQAGLQGWSIKYLGE